MVGLRTESYEESRHSSPEFRALARAPSPESAPIPPVSALPQPLPPCEIPTSRGNPKGDVAERLKAAVC